MSTLQPEFDEIYKLIKKEFTLSPKHHNGTGYFNPLVHIKFDDVEPLKFLDEGGRRGFIVPIISYKQLENNIVYFERYSNTDNNIIIAQHTTPKGEFSEEDKLVQLITIKEFLLDG